MSKHIIGWVAFAMLVLLTSCEQDPNADIADVQLEIDFHRVDPLLYEASLALQDTSAGYLQVFDQYLQEEKEFLFLLAGLDLVEQEKGPIPASLVDTLIALQLGPFLADNMTLHLLDTLQQIFPPDFPMEARIDPVLKRYHKYFPEVNLPAFRTHINGYGPTAPSVDQVMITPHFFSFGMHYFAGEDFPYYSPQLPMYIRRRFEPDYIEVVLAQELAKGTVLPVPPDSRPSLLDKMIREGIRLYLVDRLLPSVPDSMILYYSAPQMEWAETFETEIYKELTPKFFEVDFLTHRDYLTEKPFTTELSQESAPRLGEFLGWRIVEAFMERNPDVTLSELCQEQDYQKIFREAKYKP